jgi:hypothetical protein
MRLPLALAALALSLPPTAVSAQPRRTPAIVDARMGTNVTWSQQRRPRPVTYRFGDVTLEVRPVADNGLFAPRVTVRQGRSSAVMNGAAAQPSYEHKMGVGRLDRRGTRFVYFQSFTGGAHCCNEVQAAVIGPRGIRVVSFGSFDGGPEDAFPRDLDGDGNVDFVQGDDAFLYTFSSYAGSMAPPKIFNLAGGHVVDVSTRPGFRRLFREAMNRARPNCVQQDGERNGACAGYVASAARIGQFGAAWAVMLRSYDRDSGWDLPTGCRVAPNAGGECPPASVIRYANYPDALRAFLVEQGYIAR